MISAQVAPLLAVCGRTEAINVREGGRAWLPMVLAAELTQAPPFESLESVACKLSPSLPVDSWLRSCDVRYFSHCAPLARQLRLDRITLPDPIKCRCKNGLQGRGRPPGFFFLFSLQLFELVLCSRQGPRESFSYRRLPVLPPLEGRTTSRRQGWHGGCRSRDGLSEPEVHVGHHGGWRVQEKRRRRVATGVNLYLLFPIIYFLTSLDEEEPPTCPMVVED